MKKTELLAIGGAYIDINCPNFPFAEQGLDAETETVGDEYEVVLGGSALNFARLCQSLEVPTMFVGKIGDDTMGNILADLLKQSGVQPELIVSSGHATNIGFNMINDADKIIMAVAGNANQSLTSDEVYEQASARLADCSHLYIGGCFKLKKLMSAFEHLAATARSMDTTVVLDHGRLTNGVTEEDKEHVRQLAKSVDYYLPSADELMQLWDVTSVDDGLRMLESQVTGEIVVKDGENGAVTIVNGKVTRVPAFAIDVIHPVGAGDSFNAGFIAARSHGDELLSSIKFGCATAALKISLPALPTRQSVKEFMR